MMLVTGGTNKGHSSQTAERLHLSRNRWKCLPEMKKGHSSHASTILNQSLLYLIDKKEISVLNIECSHQKWMELQIIRLEFSLSGDVFAERWKNGLIVFNNSEEPQVLSEEGASCPPLKLKEAVDCYHGLSTFSLRRSLLVCDDRC